MVCAVLPIVFTLAAFTGLRRGELLGLEWKDIDWDNHLISVKRTSAWTKEKGIYTDTPVETGYLWSEMPILRCCIAKNDYHNLAV